MPFLNELLQHLFCSVGDLIFTPMSDGVNNLLTELIGNTPDSAQLAASIMSN